MNPLTLVKRIQSINSKEAELGISEEASWHAKYKSSAYVFVGGIPFDLTEGDLLAVFAQCGEIVDVNLVRDKGTGKSKGFAFVAYEDQRSTNLAVDNLNGATIAGRIIRVDHVSNYKKKEEEDEETERQKREARGVCRAFQRGECTRGASCKFSHDEQRAANTGWGPQDKGPRWGHDSFESLKKNDKRSAKEGPSESHIKQTDKREDNRLRRHDASEIERKSREDYHMRDEKRSRRHDGDEFEPKMREDNHREDEKRLRRHGNGEFVPRSREDYHRRDERRLRRHEDDRFEPKSREDDNLRDERRLRRHDGDGLERRSRDIDDSREEKRLKRHESGSYVREDDDKRAQEKWSAHGKDSSSSHYRERDDHRRKSDK
ncbi:zinc finger CCCH domain-containing protein 25 [Ricinus communis]|uniref:zinc finger CCCH domain-containing protein 25 n=1 Tax=Ricinus communis TaxID=3988 RepID=UPI0007726C47|nr:zinc finger CCCH domain-containing protein 25 [Ricinus communis]|eukprot:XP_015578766.1 zinc finger CCCH domain-containing protein 25 [Ricinus communis]